MPKGTRLTSENLSTEDLSVGISVGRNLSTEDPLDVRPSWIIQQLVDLTTKQKAVGARNRELIQPSPSATKKKDLEYPRSCPPYWDICHTRHSAAVTFHILNWLCKRLVKIPNPSRAYQCHMLSAAHPELRIDQS